jgi:hypothetical protein
MFSNNNQNQNKGNSRIRILHNIAAENGFPVNVHIDNTERFRNVKYKASTPYVTISSGKHEIKVKPINLPGAKELVQRVNLKPGQDYTVVAQGLLQPLIQNGPRNGAYQNGPRNGTYQNGPRNGTYQNGPRNGTQNGTVNDNQWVQNWMNGVEPNMYLAGGRQGGRGGNSGRHGSHGGHGGHQGGYYNGSWHGGSGHYDGSDNNYVSDYYYNNNDSESYPYENYYYYNGYLAADGDIDAKKVKTPLELKIYEDNVNVRKDRAQVDFIHAAAGAPKVDVYVNDQKVWDKITYGADTSAKRITPGKYKVKVNLAGTDKTVVGPVDLTFDKEKVYTIVASGLPGSKSDKTKLTAVVLKADGVVY